MYVVTVKFAIDAAHRERFLPAILANARASLESEIGCKQFDVCVSPDDPCAVFLYELYDSLEAFQAHLSTRHFQEFDAAAAPWIRSKDVAIYERQSHNL